MRLPFAAPGALVALASLAVVASQQPPTFRSGTQIVSLFVTVADAQKRLVPDLAQEDFEIFDNDKPQSIVYFDKSIRPISVVVMLDMSGSMTLSIDLLKRAAEQFLIRRAREQRQGFGLRQRDATLGRGGGGPRRAEEHRRTTRGPGVH